MFPKTLLNPPVNGKIHGLFSRPLSVFQVLFKVKSIFKDFSRQSYIFKYFSSLHEPCRINVLAQGHNTVTPVRLQPAAPWSQVKHSTTALTLCVSNIKELFR